jgi:hypothetical protein
MSTTATMPVADLKARGAYPAEPPMLGPGDGLNMHLRSLMEAINTERCHLQAREQKLGRIAQMLDDVLNERCGGYRWS